MNVQSFGGIFLGGVLSYSSYLLLDKAVKLLGTVLHEPCNETCFKAASLFEEKLAAPFREFCNDSCKDSIFQQKIIDLTSADKYALGINYVGFGYALAAVSAVCFLYAGYHCCCSTPKEKTN